MKNKYQRLSASEKKQARLDYNAASDLNKNIYTRLTRSSIGGIILMIYGLGFIIYSLINYAKWYEYLAFSFCLIIGLLLFIYSRKIYLGKVNQFLINKTKQSKK